MHSFEQSLCQRLLTLALVSIAFLQASDRVAELAKQAGIALAASDFPEAERGYRAVLAIDPGLAEMRSNLGVALYMQGKYEEAEQEFGAAARANAGLFVPNYFLGVRLFKTNRYALAKTYLAAALSIKPGDLQTREWLGATHIGLQEYDQAILQYRQILNQDPRYVDALYAIGKVYIHLMDRSLKNISTGPENAYYGLLLVEAVGSGKDWHKLVDAKLPLILRANPLTPALRYEFGILRLRSGQAEEAAQLFREAIRIDPWSFEAYYSLAQTSLASGRYESFTEELKKAVTIRPEFFCPAPLAQLEISTASLEGALQHVRDPLATEFLAAQLRRKNSFCAHVAPYLQRSIANDRSSGKTAEALFHEKRYEAAISLWTGRSKPPYSRASLLAQAYFHVGKFEQAAAVANSLAHDPKFRYLADYLLSKSYQGLALQTLAEIGRIAPDSYRTHQLMGEAFFVRHNLQEAITEFEAALARKPNDATLYYQLGRTYYSMAEFSSALSALERSLEMDQSDADAHYLAGKVFLSVQRPAKAIAAFEAALRLNPLMVTARAELGKAYLRMNQWHAAARELKLASGTDVGGELYYQLFRAYSELNEREKAQQALAESKRRREEKLHRERAKLESSSSP